eukprot:CAMPEP_0172440256 /NCGR_PEP_ID=MMETSP1065-20121228/945_1 /TAXON_ID=265537 /ORGANISM="Amphiprora paludosa, Strain CCMP125" /LENGTH=196 /DNA_ID=CAMNT_0013189043 /DNA_START=65 /DNA_END=655 /DNA_ORIENTATION=+
MTHHDNSNINSHNAMMQSLGHDAVLHPSPIQLTGRPPVMLYLSWDLDSLSPYQVLLRKNIELFEANHEDVESHAKVHANLPSKPIVLGQVGIRCRHCAHLHALQRAPGATYYPAKREGVYQAAQNLGNSHLIEVCPSVPEAVRKELLHLRSQKASGRKGKKAWGDRLTVLGVYEDTDILRFALRLDAFRDQLHKLE